MIKCKAFHQELINKKGDRRSLPYCEVVCNEHLKHIYFPTPALSGSGYTGIISAFVGTPRSRGKDMKEKR